MPGVKIIGVGSDQGGDRAGWQLVEKLQQADFDRKFEPGSVSLAVCRFPAQLMQLLDGCDCAIILDAVKQPIGRIFEYSRQDLALSPQLHSTHGIGVGEALALAEKLLPAPPLVKVLGIGIGRQDDDETLVDLAPLLLPLQSVLEEAVLHQAGRSLQGGCSTG